MRDEGGYLCAGEHAQQRARPEIGAARNFGVCERRGWAVAAEYVDAGVSGAKDRRPELDKLMADAHRRRFDVLIVWKFDRFARSVSHLLRALETFNALGIAYVSLTEGIERARQRGNSFSRSLGLSPSWNGR